MVVGHGRGGNNRRYGKGNDSHRRSGSGSGKDHRDHGGSRDRRDRKNSGGNKHGFTIRKKD